MKCVVTLHALLIIFSISTAYATENEDEKSLLEKRERVEYIKQLEKENAELKVKLTSLEIEKQLLIEESVDREVDKNRESAELKALRVAAAKLFLTKDEDLTNQQLLEIAVKLIKNQNDALKNIQKSIDKLSALLSVDKTDDTVSPERLIGRLREISKEIVENLGVLPLVAKRGGKSEIIHHVLTVKYDLNMVVLDSGANNQLKLGTTFVIQMDGEEDVVLRVVNVRRSMCATKVIKGDITKVQSGMEVNKQTRK